MGDAEALSLPGASHPAHDNSTITRISPEIPDSCLP